MTSLGMPTTSAAAALADLIDSGARLTRELLGVLQTEPSLLLREVQAQGNQTLGSVRRQLGGCGCEIPDPCWMPERLPKLSSHACAGATVKVRVEVTNCGIGARQVAMLAVGQGAESVKIDPPSVTVGPFASATITASVSVPDGADGADADRDLQLWIRGCRDHVLPWHIGVSERGCSCVHEVAVDDCPDLVHHWYDHFYCARGCQHGRTRADDG